MMKIKHLIYALDKRIGGKSVGDRISSVRRQLMKFNSNPLEDREYIESRESLESRKIILQLLDRYDAQPHHDPIIAVLSWKDIAHPEVVKKLYAGSYSVLIAENAKDFDQQTINGGKDYMGSGPVMSHVLENNAKLKSYLDSLGIAATRGENKLNNDHQQNAEIYASMMWGHIKRIAKTTNTIVQSAIAKRLNEEGYKTAEGAEISQSHIHRFISRAQKRDEWEILNKEFHIADKKKREPDFLDTLKLESDPEPQ